MFILHSKEKKGCKSYILTNINVPVLNKYKFGHPVWWPLEKIAKYCKIVNSKAQYPPFSRKARTRDLYVVLLRLIINTSNLIVFKIPSIDCHECVQSWEINNRFKHKCVFLKPWQRLFAGRTLAALSEYK